MFKNLAILVSTSLLLTQVPSSANADSIRSETWRSLSITALNKFATLDNGSNQSVMAYAYAAGASARLYGWRDSRTIRWLNEVYERTNPDGGWGLNRSYDAFGDGSTNPASTTYTITLAGHVGPVLLEGYRAGVVPRTKVQTIVNLLMTTRRIDTAAGSCIAYSRALADARPGYCVHNVNAAAGWFLQETVAVGIGASGLQKLVVNITRREVSIYNAATMWWPYRDTTALGDTDHNSVSAEAIYRLAYPIGREVAYNHLTNLIASTAPLAHMRLIGLPGGPGSMSGSTTLWCVLGDRWIAEASAFIANPPDPAGNRLAQAAWYATANMKQCV